MVLCIIVISSLAQWEVVKAFQRSDIIVAVWKDGAGSSVENGLERD